MSLQMKSSAKCIFAEVNTVHPVTLSLCIKHPLDVYISQTETVCFTYCTHEAGVVPGESQRLQELVARFDGKVTSVTAGAEEGVVI